MKKREEETRFNKREVGSQTVGQSFLGLGLFFDMSPAGLLFVGGMYLCSRYTGIQVISKPRQEQLIRFDYSG